MQNFYRFRLALLLAFCAGCSTLATMNMDERYGKADSTNRDAAAKLPELSAELPQGFYHESVKPVIDSRCVVCHACYDAPCQLKMSSAAAIDRGASKEMVYQGARLVAADPQRMFDDAQTTRQWRERDFFPVLNERQQTPEANTQASVLARMLMLKQQHPLPEQKVLDDRFDFSLDREQQCPTIEEFDDYAKEQPFGGMPFGLPELEIEEYQVLMRWIQAGAPIPEPVELTQEEQKAAAELEAFLNQSSLKAQLMARYIYEHLFTSHLYFDQTAQAQPVQYYSMVRSSTPPGQPIQVIATRRPFDDPQIARVYYRLRPVISTIVNKTHQPYAINSSLVAKWEKWFLAPDYSVSELPGYEPEVAANPLLAFIQLPVNARYRFMLERAENTIEGFIKGPVCRGQVALNVINDRFWVYFLDPKVSSSEKLNQFYASQIDNLHLPAEQESTAFAVNWLKYAKLQGDYMRARTDFLNGVFSEGKHLTLDAIWDGDGSNQNASLTVFRHFDNATVVKGLVGAPPKTAWVIDYSLLERIHYLLVAGFDVYGNYGHQLLTRLYMDFLRMEGESNFLSFLPPETRRAELKDWYQHADSDLTDFIEGDINPFQQDAGITYTTQSPKLELFGMLGEYLNAVQTQEYRINQSQLSDESLALLEKLAQIRGQQATLFPELTMLMVMPRSGEPQLFTLIRNSAHFNISSLFNEDENRDPASDDLTLVRGLLGSYPNAFWLVPEQQLSRLVERAGKLKTESDYHAFLDDFGVRRTAEDFWQFSDTLNRQFAHDSPLEAGWLDYNRLENR
ncbi:9-hexadecenoic acid cis-trans isomerase [Alteromonas aestuariivivens]|uniref:9-hexadecenoic acid cis-trans isomerase n=1 Tax=Alteromonas aestuariivivens TaxID=1938339 RepID=A0A3D8M396_9ALTE|nr:fatty acid cis/trans isomerase [Alteromonas aestuariivivens]RDV24004.1 9-hexadecenoic acid cis-trans isomerase [Alteromonas aestuariivivens]